MNARPWRSNRAPQRTPCPDRRAGSVARGWLELLACVLSVCGCGKFAQHASQPHGTNGDSQAVGGAERVVLPEPIFEEVASSLGLDFRHVTETPGTYFFPEIMGPGVALLDYDGDGDLDVYAVNLGRGYGARFGLSREEAAPSAGSPPLAADDAPPPTNRFYRQRSDGTFEDISEEVGLADAGWGMGAAVGDVNNDGRPDIYVTNFGPDRLYVNTGERFVDVTESAGIANPQWGTSACFCDFDLDGRLDLFVTNYVDYLPRPCTQLAGGGQDYCAPHVFRGSIDRLFRNVTPPGAGPEEVRFEDVTLAAGIATRRGPGLGVTAADFDGDGRPDFYVANDQQANVLWRNRGDGTFEDRAAEFGVAYGPVGQAQAGMGLALADINGDAVFDILVTHLEGEQHALYVSQMQASSVIGFEDRSAELGIGHPSLPATGFGCAFADFDLDGRLDLAVANGHVRRPSAANRSPGPPNAGAGDSCDRPDESAHPFWRVYAQANGLWLRTPEGRFRPAHSATDPFMCLAGCSRGLAAGDIDNDGDVDLVVGNTGGRLRVYRNRTIDGRSRSGPRTGEAVSIRSDPPARPPAPARSWIGFRCVDPQRGGRDAYGAVVILRTNRRVDRRLVNPGQSYLSSHDPRVHFGISGDLERVEVHWPGGEAETFTGCRPGRYWLLRRGAGAAEPLPNGAN